MIILSLCARMVCSRLAWRSTHRRDGSGTPQGHSSQGEPRCLQVQVLAAPPRNCLHVAPTLTLPQGSPCGFVPPAKGFWAFRLSQHILLLLGTGFLPTADQAAPSAIAAAAEDWTQLFLERKRAMEAGRKGLQSSVATTAHTTPGGKGCCRSKPSPYAEGWQLGGCT